MATLLWVASAVLLLPLSGSVCGDLYYVDGSVTMSGNGLTWGTAIKYLDEALDDYAILEDDVIWVAAGTYKPYHDGAPYNEAVGRRVFSPRKKSSSTAALMEPNPISAKGTSKPM